MFISFVLEDYRSYPRAGSSSAPAGVAVLLVASSYVTWTYQTGTFFKLD